MPFKSTAQRAFMFIHHPDIARRWADKYGGGKNLPKHVKRKRRNVRRSRERPS